MSDVHLLIENGENGKRYWPVCEGEISWETERQGSPGRLEFTVRKDGILDFQEGNTVRMSVDGKDVFYGFVFTKKRSGSDGGAIKVTAYDQLRYFKNKDTYVYKDKTADELLAMIAADFRLKVGELEPTGYKIAYRSEGNKTLLDIMQSALDLTLTATKKLYVLYDDYGKLTLKNIESMKLPILICDKTAQDFEYASSIDSNTYNKIKLCYDNKDARSLEVYVTQDSAHMNNWGVLQMYEKIDSAVNARARADAMLSLYNRKSRTLSVKNAFGDIRVRGGSSVPVMLDLGDMVAQTYMIVEKVKHTITAETHFMDLTLRGNHFSV